MSVGQQNGGKTRPAQETAVKPGGADQPADWDALKEDVSGIAGVAAERGRHFMDAARTQATTFVDQRKNDAAKSVVDLAESLRQSLGGLDDRPNIKAFVDSAADGLVQFADTIRDRSFNEIFENVEQAARRRPAAVAAATMAAGFIVARFLKSSAEGIRQMEAQKRRAAGQARGAQGQRPRAAQGAPAGAGRPAASRV